MYFCCTHFVWKRLTKSINEIIFNKIQFPLIWGRYFPLALIKFLFSPVVWRLRAFNLLKYVIPSFILAVEAFSSPSFIKNLMSDSIWIFCFLLFYTSLSNNFLSSPLLAASFFRYCLYYCLAHLAEESMSFNIGTFSTPTIAYHSMAALSMANKSYLICLYLD